MTFPAVKGFGSLRPVWESDLEAMETPETTIFGKKQRWEQAGRRAGEPCHSYPVMITKTQPCREQMSRPPTDLDILLHVHAVLGAGLSHLLKVGVLDAVHELDVLLQH